MSNFPNPILEPDQCRKRGHDRLQLRRSKSPCGIVLLRGYEQSPRIGVSFAGEEVAK